MGVTGGEGRYSGMALEDRSQPELPCSVRRVLAVLHLPVNTQRRELQPDTTLLPQDLLHHVHLSWQHW